jgi:hypothetical protein
LEWLASELVRGGWRLKPIHRTIVLSAAYRQSSDLGMRNADFGLKDRAGRSNPQSPIRDPQSVDPENRLLWRRKLRRMESEVVRDSLLAVAGTLNPEMYGKGFKPPIQPDALQARNVKDPYPREARDTPETRRRTVYMFHKRVTPYPLLQAFDGPDASAPCGRRNITTVAPQALAILNDPFVRLRALEFARRLQREAGADAAAQVRRAYGVALGRKPTARELDASVRFLERQASAHAGRKPGTEPAVLALADFAHVVFGLNEFLYVD